tara:strand:+ start:14928 stop:15167 length:240 start_codon:yes stop_codon:yes gene_type:complete
MKLPPVRKEQIVFGWPNIFGVNKKTSWLFRQKAPLAMKSSEQYPLEAEVHVDELEIGTPQAGEQGRSKSGKKVRTVIAF